MKFELDEGDTDQIIRTLETMRKYYEKQKHRSELRGFRPRKGAEDINTVNLGGINRVLRTMKAQMRSQERKGQ